MTRRTDLLENPAFWGDIRSDMTRDAIMRKWGCSAGFVHDRRVDARDGLPGDASAAVADAYAPRPQRAETSTDEDGTHHFKEVRDRPVTMADAREWIRHSGDDPDRFNLSVRSIVYGPDLFSNKMSATPKGGTEGLFLHDLTHLLAEASRPLPPHRRPAAPERLACVVPIADWQIGKTGRRGGTPELLVRLASMRELMELELERRRPERIFIFDGGDGAEGFESGGNPMFTNDLSHPDQLDLYGVELHKTIVAAHRYGPVEVCIVPSNHTAWRRAKMVLGKPTDDWGLFVHRQVQRRCEDAGMDVTWHYPAEYDESVCVDVLGTPVGLVHGSQFGPGGAITWWEKQAFGCQAVTRADVLLTAHYHSFGAGVAGINPHTGRERFWVGLPTEDNGSDHYRLTAGRDSEPNTVIFNITEAGFDLGSLAFL